MRTRSLPRSKRSQKEVRKNDNEDRKDIPDCVAQVCRETVSYEKTGRSLAAHKRERGRSPSCLRIKKAWSGRRRRHTEDPAGPGSMRCWKRREMWRQKALTRPGSPQGSFFRWERRRRRFGSWRQAWRRRAVRWIFRRPVSREKSHRLSGALSSR